jgi:hypothetical protein
MRIYITKEPHWYRRKSRKTKGRPTVLQDVSTLYVIGIAGIMDFVRHPVLQNKYYRTQRFANWICFRPSQKGREAFNLLGPFRKTNHNH